MIIVLKYLNYVLLIFFRMIFDNIRIKLYLIYAFYHVDVIIIWLELRIFRIRLSKKKTFR